MEKLVDIEQRDKYKYIKILMDLSLDNSMKVQSIITPQIKYEDVLVVDLEEVAYAASTGVGLFLILMKLSRKVYFINLRNSVRKVLDIVGFSSYMNVTNFVQAEAEINGY